MQGYVTKSNVCCKRITYVAPIKHDYGDNYFKYSCPVCDALENPHQVSIGQKNCPLCNVNLIWKDESEE